MSEQFVIRWKPGLGKIYDADAEKVAQEIADIGGSATPEQIVEKGKGEDTELHKCFEWDDTEAARQYRIVQARDIVRCLYIVRVEPDESQEEQAPTEVPLVKAPFFRAFSHLNSQLGYSQTIHIVKDEDRYKELLEQAKRELKAFSQKYACLKELENIIEMIDEL